MPGLIGHQALRTWFEFVSFHSAPSSIGHLVQGMAPTMLRIVWANGRSFVCFLNGSAEFPSLPECFFFLSIPGPFSRSCRLSVGLVSRAVRSGWNIYLLVCR